MKAMRSNAICWRRPARRFGAGTGPGVSNPVMSTWSWSRPTRPVWPGRSRRHAELPTCICSATIHCTMCGPETGQARSISSPLPIQRSGAGPHSHIGDLCAKCRVSTTSAKIGLIPGGVLSGTRRSTPLGPIWELGHELEILFSYPDRPECDDR